METVAVGFWGAFFGAAALSIGAAIAVFTRAVRRVAITASLAALIAAAYVIVFLGWVPLEGDDQVRLQAFVALASSTVLALLLFDMLGTLRVPVARRWARWCIGLVAPAAVLATALLQPLPALVLALTVEAAIVACAFSAAAASVARGERSALPALAALPFMSITIAVLDWNVLHGPMPWVLHAVGAVAGIGFYVCIGIAMWVRYAYLHEISRVMTHGPDYDAVARMPWWRNGQLEIPAATAGRTIGVIVVSISNLRAQEDLHGHAAANHAAFICASRLRRIAGTQPTRLELRRLDVDAFVAFVPQPREIASLMHLARTMLERMSRPVMLGTSEDLAALDARRSGWQANLGIGLLITHAGEDPDLAVNYARDLSRTAWTYPNRIAWYDEHAQRIAEVPATQ